MDAEKADRQEAEERAGDKLETLQERCWRGLGGFSGVLVALVLGWSACGWQQVQNLEFGYRSALEEALGREQLAREALGENFRAATWARL